MAKAKHPFIDQDTTDEFLDKKPIRYTDGTYLTVDDERLDPEYRKEHGLPPLQPLPPPVDH